MLTLIKSPETPDQPDKKESYIWESNQKHMYRGCNSMMIFPFSINLYLKCCSNNELNRLLNRKYFLKIDLFDNKDEMSCVAAQLLSINGLVDENYQKLINSCPDDMVPCVMMLGPFWHLLWLNKEMCIMKHIMVMVGSQLVGRDAFSGESEDDIQIIEKREEIFIVRE